MQPQCTFTQILGLAVSLVTAACTNPGGPDPPAEPMFRPVPLSTSLVPGFQARLGRFTYTTRNVFVSDYTYDEQGRQASVWSYTQRAGEDKRFTAPMVIVYDTRNRIVRVETGQVTTDSVGNAVALRSVSRRQEYSYEGNRITIRTVLGTPDELQHAYVYTYELDNDGHYVRQVTESKDGTKTTQTYQYADGNVVQVEELSTDETGQVKARYRSQYAYDSHPNPLFGLLDNASGAHMAVPTYSSRNNVVTWTFQTLSPDGVQVMTTTTTAYTYRYNDRGYPVSYQGKADFGEFTYR